MSREVALSCCALRPDAVRDQTEETCMFYEPRLGHGLPHDPFKAIVAPRPIGWISTLNAKGRPNLAPYSFFNAVHSRPPMLAFTSETMKHSAANAIATGEFVFNLCTRPLFDAMNISSGALGDDESEFDAAGLETAACRMVKAPRVAASPASLECRVVHSMQLHDLDGRALEGWVIIGQVVGVHIDEAFLRDGRFDTAAAQSLARCGYRDYAAVTELFEALRPTDEGAFVPGQRDK
jgi:flavin reductase (DIM6/NTAB) family NADH-FMN oxidoreductase RutF